MIYLSSGPLPGWSRVSTRSQLASSSVAVGVPVALVLTWLCPARKDGRGPTSALPACPGWASGQGSCPAKRALHLLSDLSLRLALACADEHPLTSLCPLIPRFSSLFCVYLLLSLQYSAPSSPPLQYAEAPARHPRDLAVRRPYRSGRTARAASLGPACISLTHWLAAASRCSHSTSPSSHVSASSLIRCTLLVQQPALVAGLMEASLACHGTSPQLSCHFRNSR